MLVTALIAGPSSTAPAHPLHTTLTEMTEDRPRQTVRATIRVFADDFGAAITPATKAPARDGPAWDAAALAYVTRTFVVTDRSGRRLPLRSCGTRKTGDLLWICVELTSAAGLAGLQIRDSMLCDIFDDQVNVVQGTVGGSRKSLLFTRGDKPKLLT